MSPEYHVRWELDLTADSPREAAAYAQSIQRDPESWANYFEVWDGLAPEGEPYAVDLDEEN